MQRRSTDAGTIYLLKDDSVLLKGTLEQEAILDAAAKVYAATSQPLVVTSANDGTHMDGSLHYEDKALDLRVWELQDHEAVANKMQALLWPDYDVLAEWTTYGEHPSHIHAEYDPD